MVEQYRMGNPETKAASNEDEEGEVLLYGAEERKCHICGKTGHLARDCRLRRGGPPFSSPGRYGRGGRGGGRGFNSGRGYNGGRGSRRPAAFQGECNYCGKWGHKKADCWKLQNLTSQKRNRGRSNNDVGGASMEIVLMHADLNDDDEEDLQYKDQKELEKRERMIRTNGPNYCHYTLRQQDMMQNHCLGREDLAMATCKHCGAEGLTQNFMCEVCKIGEFGTEEEYQEPVPYGYCEQCALKGYLGYNCGVCKPNPDTGKYPKCIAHKIDMKKGENDEGKDKGHDNDDKDNDNDKDKNKDDNNEEDDRKQPSNKKHKSNNDKEGWGAPTESEWGQEEKDTGGWGSQTSKNLEFKPVTTDDDVKEGENDDVNLMAYIGTYDKDDESIYTIDVEEGKDKQDDNVNTNWVLKDDPPRYVWKDSKENDSDEHMVNVQKIARLQCYTDSDWKEVTLLKNKELEVKCARKHNQLQLQRAIEQVKNSTNDYIRNLFLDIDPAGNYTNHIPHLIKLKITLQIVNILKSAKAFSSLKPVDETDVFEVDDGIDRHMWRWNPHNNAIQSGKCFECGDFGPGGRFCCGVYCFNYGALTAAMANAIDMATDDLNWNKVKKRETMLSLVFGHYRD